MYLLPENPSAGEPAVKHICVTIPDLPEYQRALLGSLVFLASWTAWERDIAHGAREAAARWASANAETFKRLNNDCGEGAEEMICDCPTIEDIRREIENMAISIVNNLCCGNAGATTTTCGGATIPPEGEGEATIPPEEQPSDGTELIGWSQWACGHAHDLVSRFANLAEQIAEITNIADDEVDYEHYLMVVSSILRRVRVIPYWFFFLLMAAAIEGLTEWFANRFSAAIEAKRTEFVCAILSARSATEAGEAFREVIARLDLSWPERYWIRLLEQNISYSWLYDEDWALIAPATLQEGWSCCDGGGGGDIPPFIENPPPEGCAWVYPSDDAAVLDLGRGATLVYHAGVVDLAYPSWPTGDSPYWWFECDLPRFADDRVVGVEIQTFANDGGVAGFWHYGMRDALEVEGHLLSIDNFAALGVRYGSLLTCDGLDLSPYDDTYEGHFSTAENHFAFSGGANGRDAASVSFRIRFLVLLGGRE